MCHISVREDYKMDKQILFSSYQFLPGGHASGSLKGLLAFVAGTKGAVAAFSPLTVYNAMYAGHHLTGRYCLSLSHLFISFCRKRECKAFHYLCWLADLGSGSRQGTHFNTEHAHLQSFWKSSVWPSQDPYPWQYDSSYLSSPHAACALNIKNNLKSMSGLAFNDTWSSLSSYELCFVMPLWCTVLLLILHQHSAHLTWWMWASALSHFLWASWSCSLQSALLQSQLFAFLLSIHPCIIRHVSYSHLSMKTPKEFLHLQSTVGYFFT